MSDIHADIKGKGTVLQKLGKLEYVAKESVLIDAATAGAMPIENAIKLSAPKKTRTLSRSFTHNTKVLLAYYVEVGIGSDVPYARIHEFGGTILPRKAKALAIPRTKQAETYHPRSFPGGLKLVWRKGADSGVLLDSNHVVQYSLVKSVTIPAKPYVRPSVEANKDNAIAEISRTLEDLVRTLVK